MLPRHVRSDTEGEKRMNSARLPESLSVECTHLQTTDPLTMAA